MQDSELSNSPVLDPVKTLPPQSDFAENENLVNDPDAVELCTHAETTRVGRWKNRLLDLSLRNTLLNFDARSARSTTLRFIVHDINEFENALASDGVRFELVPGTLSGDAETDSEEARQQALITQAKILFPKKTLLTEVPPMRSREVPADERLRERLLKIYRGTNSAIAETGANTLFIALGFLCWQCDKRPGETLRAPLVLIPAKLERPRGENRFFLRAADEDVRLNLTLSEMLRQEFGILTPELEATLPEDESGVDMAEIFRIFRNAIAGREGFFIEESCALGNFSFAKYLMWRDLEERPEILARSRIVRHLMDETQAPFKAEKAFPSPHRLDELSGVSELLCPLSADSSQTAAIRAAADGKHFILVGPPGTGKSQTIANLIAHTLSEGKTVLFVAEKAAALNVVFRRLKKIGIGDFCLELHSDKTNKRTAYTQFAASLELASTVSTGTGAQTHANAVRTARNLRDKLLQLPKILHKKRENGLSLADAVGVICNGEALPSIDFTWEEPLADSLAMRERKVKIVGDLSAAFKDVRDVLARESGKISVQRWSQAWQRSTEAAAKALGSAGKNFRSALTQLVAVAGLAPQTQTLALQSAWVALLDAVLAVRGESSELVLGSEAKARLESLRAAATLAENCARHKALLSLPYPANASADPSLDALLKTWREGEISWALPRWLKHRKVIRALRILADGTPEMPLDPRVDLGNLIAIRTCKKEFAEKYSAIVTAFPSLVKDCDSVGRLPRIHALEKARAQAETLLSQVGSEPETQAAWRSAIEAWMRLPAGTDSALTQALAQTQAAWTVVTEALAALCTATGMLKKADTFESIESPEQFAENLLVDRELWRDICAWNESVKAAERRGIDTFAEALRSGAVTPETVCAVFEVNYCRRWAEAVYDSEPALLEYVSGKNLSRIGKFRAADAALRAASATLVRERLIERSRGVNNKACAAELSLLRHEIEKRRAHLPIRRFLARAPQMLRLLKPCLLTSPLSAAQYLDVSAEPFDLVVFDEASQIAVWDAVGALARGKSAVVVGDPKQLPPTSFFQACKFSEANNTPPEASSVPDDAESVLDECHACGVPAMKLSWHYRSRAENLIAFSNARYYAGNLMTFPAPKTHDRSLEYVFCENGIYAAGTSRTNREEARALVERIVDELSHPDFVYNEFSSIGVVTFNAQQQELIQRLLDDARETHPEIRKYFSEDEVAEPVFVKNLENVQGDERGVIYFSTTFGPDADGNVGQNFGPLNRDGGERRLNVAITRSRAGMRVFTSLRPGDIRTNAGGMADLRDFLEFARSGTFGVRDENASLSAREQGGESTGKAAEDALAESLEARGWQCRRNVGFSGMRVDIAVVHPDREEEFLAGILCDGADSMAIPTVRDREILREEVLKNLGWNVMRAWMLDRWQTPELSIARLDARLKTLLEKSRGVLSNSAEDGVSESQENV